jgi:hypothetical protein
LAFAARGELGEGVQNLKRLLAIDRAELPLGVLGLDKCAHAPHCGAVSPEGTEGAIKNATASSLLKTARERGAAR